jgi:hypothetical protein
MERYNLALLSQFDKVFLFDYLINGLSTTDALIVTQYTTNANAAKYKST